MRRSLLLVSCLMILAAGAAANPSDQCRNSPKRTGACYVVHGRLAIANGFLNHRIWPTGSHHMLAVVDAQDHYDENRVPLPPPVVRALKRNPDARIYADFEVCPLTPAAAGAMRHVCVAGASRLIVLGRR